MSIKRWCNKSCSVKDKLSDSRWNYLSTLKKEIHCTAAIFLGYFDAMLLSETLLWQQMVHLVLTQISISHCICADVHHIFTFNSSRHFFIVWMHFSSDDDSSWKHFEPSSDRITDLSLPVTHACFIVFNQITVNLMERYSPVWNYQNWCIPTVYTVVYSLNFEMQFSQLILHMSLSGYSLQATCRPFFKSVMSCMHPVLVDFII